MKINSKTLDGLSLERESIRKMGISVLYVDLKIDHLMPIIDSITKTKNLGIT